MYRYIITGEHQEIPVQIVAKSLSGAKKRAIGLSNFEIFDKESGTYVGGDTAFYRGVATARVADKIERGTKL
jgi:hypothetical protein